MEKSKTNIYLNEKVKELLEMAQAFEKKVISDRESFFTSQVAVQTIKKNKPGAVYTEVKEDLLTMQKSHYNSFLLEQNLQHVLNTLIEMNTMSIVLGIELELNDDEKSALKEIGKSSTNLFTLNKNKEVVYADNELRPVIEKTINEKQNDPENLEKMFVSIPALKE